MPLLTEHTPDPSETNSLLFDLMSFNKFFSMLFQESGYDDDALILCYIVVISLSFCFRMRGRNVADMLASLRNDSSKLEIYANKNYLLMRHTIFLRFFKKHNNEIKSVSTPKWIKRTLSSSSR